MALLRSPVRHLPLPPSPNLPLRQNPPALQWRSDDTLTCSNRYLWLHGISPTKGVDNYNRFLTPTERAKLLGFDPKVVDDLGSHAEEALGNAIALPTAGIVLACLWSGLKPEKL